jgi:Ras-related protein Rab-4B
MWAENVRRMASANAINVLIGNKIDLTSERKVSTVEAADFAAQNSLSFFEASALSGEGIDDIFIEIAHFLYRPYLEGKIDTP